MRWGDFLHCPTLPYLRQGVVIAVELLVGVLAGGILIGFFLALASTSRHLRLRLPVQAYIYALRGTPVLLQLDPALQRAAAIRPALRSSLEHMLALMINETAFCAEIIRGGIVATDRNQRMAAQAFGFSAPQRDGPCRHSPGAVGDPADPRQRGGRPARRPRSPPSSASTS